MRKHPPRWVELPEGERQELERLVRDGRTEQRVARRARILPAMADHSTVVQHLAARLGQTRKTIWNVCRRYADVGLYAVVDAPRSGRPRRLSPLQRIDVERLACCEPAGVGLHMTPWSTRSLARAARDRGIAPTLAHATVSLILRDASLQPHRSRSWKTPTLDASFRERAAKVLWCYQRAEELAAQSELMVYLDEKANLQALSRRRPTRLCRRGHIERWEHEYVCHGTVTVSAG